MQVHRHLDWEGCFNVRDLGGLGSIQHGAFVRADDLDGLTPRGWDALVAHGIRTVIDLRNEGERRPKSPRPAVVDTVCLPLDAAHDRFFWDVWERGPAFGTPLYYRPHLDRFPERSAAVISAIAQARHGGVVFHCMGGRDRTGQIAMLLLALAGVAHADIAADYELSHERITQKHAARGEEDHGVVLRAYLAEHGTSGGALLHEILGTLDVRATLRRGGTTDADIAALRKRAFRGMSARRARLLDQRAR